MTAQGNCKQEGETSSLSLFLALYPSNTDGILISLSLCLVLSPRARALVARCDARVSSISTLRRESRLGAAGRLEDPDVALPACDHDDDVHRDGQRRSWPTNGRPKARGRRNVDGAVLRLVPGAPGVGAAQYTLCVTWFGCTFYTFVRFLLLPSKSGRVDPFSFSTRKVQLKRTNLYKHDAWIQYVL